MALTDWEKFYNNQSKNFIKIADQPMWNCYKRLLKNIELPKGPRIIELGCGSGYISLMLTKKYNAKATLIDYSNNALQFAKELYNEKGLKARFIKTDFFKFKPKEKFDLVHSQGVIEHFKNEEQEKLVSIHKRLLKNNGYAIILAPRPSIYYRTSRKVIEKLTGKWLFGYEKPLTLNEGIKLIESQGLKIIKTEKTALEYGYLCMKA